MGTICADNPHVRMKKGHEQPVGIRFDFDFLFYREGGHVVAHCLQTDTTAFAYDVDSAKAQLREALELEIQAGFEDGDLHAVFDRPAPDDVWKRVEESVKQHYHVLTFAIVEPRVSGIIGRLAKKKRKYHARTIDHVLDPSLVPSRN